VEIVIAKSMMEMATKETAEADDAKIKPAIVPIRIVPGVVVVSRCGSDTVWRGRLWSAGRLRGDRGVKSMRRGRGWRRGRRRRSDGRRRRLARHNLITVCRDGLVGAT
jgi:hypothetical protein